MKLKPLRACLRSIWPILFVMAPALFFLPVAGVEGCESSNGVENLGLLSPLGDATPWPLAQGTFLQMEQDWSLKGAEPSNYPDTSFKSVWVRMFPLLTTPLGDPYPVTQNLNSIELSCDKSNDLAVYSLASQALLARGKELNLDFAAGRVNVDGKSLALEPLWIHATATATTLMTWDKGLTQTDGQSAEVRIYLRGGFVVRPSLHQSPPQVMPPISQTLWSVINVVAVNDYLRSVVPSEAIASWQKETLKVQAIAARSYALYEMAEARAAGRDFDLDPSTWYQSYQGQSFWQRALSRWRMVELPLVSQAVDASEGTVVTYAGEVIKAYFSANSGGLTCLASECLPVDFNPAYIQQIIDHPTIKNAPGGNWGTKANLTAESIGGILVQTLKFKLSAPIKWLEPLERGPSGRVWRLRVTLKDSTYLDLDRPQTRQIMHLFGPIRSYLYELSQTDLSPHAKPPRPRPSPRQTVRGHGYGHGVGLSQWGAELYARSGWKADAILKHYYRNVDIRDLTK